MRLAYLILCHKEAAQVIRLIERLGPELFVVHIDKRASSDVYRPLAELAAKSSNIFLSPRCRCYWGQFGIVKATLNSMEMAVQSGLEFDYAFLLSGQDYPIKMRKPVQRGQ